MGKKDGHGIQIIRSDGKTYESMAEAAADAKSSKCNFNNGIKGKDRCFVDTNGLVYRRANG